MIFGMGLFGTLGEKHDVPYKLCVLKLYIKVTIIASNGRC